MHLLASVVLILAFAGSVAAQPADFPAVWLFITDSHLEDSDNGTTERALERRIRRGSENFRFRRIAESVREDLERRGLHVRVESHLLGAVSVELPSHRHDEVKDLPYVRGIRPVAMRHRPPDEPADILDLPARAAKAADRLDPGLSNDHLAAINTLDLLADGIDGSGVWLGFLDTEYGDFQHVAFARHRADGRIAGIRNFVGADQTNRHGLAVASVAAGRDEGTILGPAHGATLLGAVTEYAPTETRLEEDFFVAGLEWLEEQGIDVVNVSLGYTTFDDGDGYLPDDLDGMSAITTLAVQRAVDLGVIVVTSAGNYGTCGTPELCWYYIGTPADAPGAITVGAVWTDSTRAAFSSYGPTADGRIKPDVVAPGVRNVIAVEGDGYALASGTSFSAPLVAGVVAQMLQVNPDLRPAEVQSILRSTASQADTPDNSIGFGIVNAGAAVRTALQGKRHDFTSKPEILPYPNPASDRLTFQIEIPQDSFAGSLSLVDALGREVARIFDGTLSDGFYLFDVNIRGLAPGVYLYRLHGTDASISGAVVLVR